MKDVRDPVPRQDGKLSIEDAVIEMRLEPFEDLGYARVDHHRALRQGGGRGHLLRGENPRADPRHHPGLLAAARRTYCSPACAPSTMRPCAI